MVQAAALGLVDFSQSKLLDKSWQLRLRLLFRGLQAENRKQIKQAQLDYHLGLLGIAKITADSSSKIQERSQEDLRSLINLLQPWAARTKEEAEQEQAKGYRDRWSNRWGNPDSPEIKSKIADVAAALQRMREMEPPPEEMATRFGVFNAKTAATIEGLQDRMRMN
jgi:hypothetical protein